MKAREIKFQYGFEYKDGCIFKEVFYLHDIPNIANKSQWFNKLPLVYVREYTGLLDKNGNEIYERDLVEFYYKGEYVTCEVIFDNGCFKLKWNDGYINNYELNSTKYKIVGNSINKILQLINL